MGISYTSIINKEMQQASGQCYHIKPCTKLSAHYLQKWSSVYWYRRTNQCVGHTNIIERIFIMRKVNATLLYGIDEHNKYMVVKFFAVENNGVIHTIIDNANNMELAYKHESIGEMVNSMKRILKTKDLYVSPFMKNSASECCGIVCLKMYGTDFLVGNPSRVWISK